MAESASKVPFHERLHATFEQHCGGLAPALRGEVIVENPPPLPLVTVQLTVNPEGRLLKGGARVSGTFSCTRDAEVDISLTFTQDTRKGVVNGSAGLTFGSCSTTPQPWQADLVPWDAQKPFPFEKGSAAGVVTVTYNDLFYDVRRLDGGTVSTNVLLKQS